MNEFELKINIANKIVRSWNEKNINYATVHGLEKYPSSLGRDLDVFIQKSHIPEALNILQNALLPENYPVKIHRTSWGHYYIFVFNDIRIEYRLILEIDLIPEYQWGPALLTRKPETQTEIKPFKIDPWASLTKRVLFQVLGGNTKRFIDKPYEISLTDLEKKVVRHKLPEIFGGSLSEQLIESIETQNIHQINYLINALRKKLVLRLLLRKPLQFLWGSIKWAKNELAHIFTKPCVPIVALVGPDGVGKSTVIESIKKNISISFAVPEVVIKHWRPGLIPPLNKLFRKDQQTIDGPVLPRRNSGKFFLLRLMYYYIDFLVGGWFVDRPSSATLNLILYDRCALDMMVDPVRFGLSSAIGTGLLWRFTPKPDMVILLYDDPERIHKRKPELSIAEIDRQLKKWLALYKKGWVNAVIKIDASPEIIAERVRSLIMEAFIQESHSSITYTCPGEKELAGKPEITLNS